MRIDRSILLLAAALILGDLPGTAQKAKPAASATLQTELVERFATDNAVVGDKVLVRTLQEWTTGNCHLRKGGGVLGHVVAVQRQTAQSKGSSVTLVFDLAQCDGIATPVKLTLYALSTRPFNNTGGAAPDSSPLLGYSPPKETVSKGNVGTRDDTLDFASDMAYNPSDQPKSVKKGETYGLTKVTLGVGTGVGGGSVLSTPKGEIRLEPRSQIILMPPPQVDAPAGATP